MQSVISSFLFDPIGQGFILKLKEFQKKQPRR